jgi:hypothetical protein
MGGGMKVGINVWKALNTNKSVHPAWTHLASNPLTEADLPRSIEPTEGANMATGAAAAAEDAAAAAAAAKGGAAKGPVARKPTVEVKAFDEAQGETDEELADRAH